MKIKILLSLAVLINLVLIFVIYTSKIDFKKYTGYPQRHGWFEKTFEYNKINRDSVFVIMTLGQSSAGNCAKDEYQPTEEVYNYYKGRIYKAVEPLKGTNGNGGITAWSRLADRLIKKNVCKKVVIIPIARGGTSIEFWTNGKGHDLLLNTLRDLKQKNIKLTHILWHQGEANNGGNPDVYKNNLESILKTFRDNGQNANLYCAIATYSAQSKLIKDNGIDYNLQSAQKEFINENEGVFAGANTDDYINAIYRYDGQHFSSLGNIKHAELWYSAITTNSDNRY
ncbi:MAG: sialate O-acetylesterase [Flavobacteriales bacterium]